MKTLQARKMSDKLPLHFSPHVPERAGRPALSLGQNNRADPFHWTTTTRVIGADNGVLLFGSDLSTLTHVSHAQISREYTNVPSLCHSISMFSAGTIWFNDSWHFL